MLRVRKKILLSLCVASALLVGCGKDSKPRTVVHFLHNIEEAEAVLDEAKKDPVKAQTDVEVMNASQAFALKQVELQKCYISITEIDHSCLDAKGYKR